MNAAASIPVSVVIPVLNAAAHLPALREAFQAQKPVAPQEIILVDSGSTDGTRALAAAWPGARLIPLADFSHGRARNLGGREARGDLVVLMTQDALPTDEHWLANLLAPFADPQVAAVYSRQIPKPDAPPTERFFLHYHFPPGAPVRRVKTGSGPLTLQDVFFSNVSAAVRREMLLRFPFDETLIMSEDQQFSRDLIAAGYTVVYQPSSAVFHSHRYSLKTAFRRYFDSVYSLTVIFPEHGVGTSASLGLQYVRQELIYILRHYPWYLPYYGLYNLAKTMGTLAAHHAVSLPPWLLQKLSLHSYHWREQ